MCLNVHSSLGFMQPHGPLVVAGRTLGFCPAQERRSGSGELTTIAFWVTFGGSPKMWFPLTFDDNTHTYTYIIFFCVIYVYIYTYVYMRVCMNRKIMCKHRYSHWCELAELFLWTTGASILLWNWELKELQNHQNQELDRGSMSPSVPQWLPQDQPYKSTISVFWHSQNKSPRVFFLELTGPPKIYQHD